MARWDEILSLPVQNPPTLEFSAANLVWSKVEGWRDNIDRLALIPFARVDDFVRGESANKDCPSRFHVEARRRRAPKNTYKQKVDGILEYILYWCSFGPDDHRKGGVVRPSRNTYVPKKKNAGRPNTKRGCTCHFIVKRLIAEPSVALIIYNQDKHVDKKGLPCHGPQDKKAEGTRAMFAPYISEDLRLRVLSLLHVGVSVETIMQRHSESVEKQGGPSNRDDLLTHRFVRRQERSIRRSMYELDPDDAVSVSMWVENHQSNVFFYEDFSDSDPFTLGIQTEWQLQQMIRFGNRGLLASDSRLGTNKLKYPVHSLIVYNSEKKAIPVAWIITPRFACGEAHKWMRALYNRVCTKDPSWKLAGFIVDDPLTDILTVRDVFQCSVLLSFWRVRHSWHKNLVKRCSDKEVRAQIFRRLGQALDDVCRGHGNVEVFDALMEDFIDSSDFIDYFKAVWYPRLGSWTAALKALPLASHETAATMEFYHNQMKIRLLNEKNCDVYQRADWLMDKLGTKVHSYFWLDEYSEKDYFSRYWRDEWTSGITSWCKASNIPDSDVVIEGRCAKVTDMLDREKFHVVWNPGTEFAICSCGWAEMGNICEHVFKAIKLYRDKGYAKPSISLFQYGQALMEMLRLPTHDSLIRDYAVSLAVSVEKELKSLSDFNKNRCEINHVQEEANSLRQNVMSDQDGLAGENPSMDESASADDMDVDNDVTNGVNEVVIIDSGARPAEVKCSESSSPVSPPGIHSVDKFESKDGPNGESTDSQCPNAGGILSSKRDPSEKQIGLGADEPMDVQTPFVDICMESIEEDTVSNQNIVLSKDQEMSFISETTDVDTARGEKPNMNHARTEDVQTPFIDIPMESIEANTASNQNTVSSKDQEMSVFSEMVSFETFRTEKPNVNHAGTETNSSQQQIVISEQDRDVAVENPVMDDGTSAHDMTDAYEVKDGAQKNVVADPAKRLAENANSSEMNVGPSPISLSPARKSVDEVVSKGVENREIVTHKQHIEVCGQKNVPNNDVQMSITSETSKANHVQAEKSLPISDFTELEQIGVVEASDAKKEIQVRGSEIGCGDE